MEYNSPPSFSSAMKKWPEKGVDSLDGENLVVFYYLSTSKIWPRNRGLLYKTMFENKSVLCDIVISGIKDHKPYLHVHLVIIE